MMVKLIRQLALLSGDPWLLPAQAEIEDRFARFQRALLEIEKIWGTLSNFASAYDYYGFQYDKSKKGWTYREWAPKAKELFLFGDFND